MEGREKTMTKGEIPIFRCRVKPRVKNGVFNTPFVIFLITRIGLGANLTDASRGSLTLDFHFRVPINDHLNTKFIH